MFANPFNSKSEKAYVKSYANSSAFPPVGSLETIYIDESTNEIYRWTGSGYVVIGEYPTVPTYADLPPAALNNGKIYLVTTSTGIYPFNHPAGFYISNGTTWTQIPATAGAITYADLHATAPITYDGSGTYGLNWNTTNLKLTGNAIDAIQAINTGATPTFSGININGESDLNGNVLIGGLTSILFKHKVTITGTDSSIFGPHLAAYSSADTYPIIQNLNWAHNNISNNYDAYYDGTNWLSSFSGSNFQTIKISNQYQFNYASNVAPGSPITWTEAGHIELLTGALVWQKPVKFNDSTDSTSLFTGSVVTPGGAAITKNLFVGGTTNIATLTASSLVSTDSLKNLVSGNLSGDITSSGLATTLATVNSNVGTFGDGTHVSQVTVNAKGLITAVNSVLITGASPTGAAGGDLAGSNYPNPIIANGVVTNAKLANSSITIGSTNISLGATNTSLAGLTSVSATTFTGALTGNASTASKWSIARNLAGNSVDGSANVAFANKFIVQGTTDAGLSGAQFLGALGTGILKNTVTTGVLSIAAAATDYVAPSAYASANGLTMSTNKLLGRSTAATGAAEEISIGSGLSLSGGVLTSSGSGGTVTSVSVVSANGFSGSVNTPSTTPAITLSTTISGILKGNGTAMSQASAGSDYEVPLTFTNGVSRTLNTVVVDTSLNIAKITNLTTNGFVKTSGSDGTLSIDTNTYLTGNQTITLSGDISGSGTTAITTSIGVNKVTNAMLRQSAALSIIGNATNATANVSDISAASDFQVLRRSGTALGFGSINLASSNAVTGILPLANGGTNANLTASNGGIFYSNASSAAILAGTATANQLLISGASAAPSWTSRFIDYGTANPGTTGGNLFVGTGCGSLTITNNSGNTGLGINCLASISTSGVTNGYNAALGYFSLNRVTTGVNNTAIGYSSGSLATTGSLNTFCGSQAGGQNAVYNSCSFFGTNADASVSGLTNSTAIGYNASVSTNNTMVLGNTSLTNINTTAKITVNNTGQGLDLATANSIANLRIIQNTTGTDKNIYLGFDSGLTSSIQLFSNHLASSGSPATLYVSSRSIGIGGESYGGGMGIMFIANAITIPSSNPSGGYAVYAQLGALKGRGASGTIVTIGNADPHCKVCGVDFTREFENEKYGGKFDICLPCTLAAFIKISGQDNLPFANFNGKPFSLKNRPIYK